MVKDRPINKPETRGMRLNIPIKIHKRLKYLKDERKYAGFNETIAEVAIALIKVGLDTMEEQTKTLPQLPVINEQETA